MKAASSVLRKLFRFRHLSKEKTPSSLPQSIGGGDALAPVVLEWLRAACQELGFLDSEHLLRLLQLTFTGSQHICDIVADDAEAMLQVLLKACDISAGVSSKSDSIADRNVLVRRFCELVCDLPEFPRCLMVEVQWLEDISAVRTEAGDTYVGLCEGEPVMLDVPKAVHLHGSQILSNPKFRTEVVRWRTLPPNEHVIPFLGLAQIHIRKDTVVCLVSPKIEAQKLAQQARQLAQQGTPEDEIVQSILQWIQRCAAALLHLHSNGLAHGRLCGDHVLLGTSGTPFLRALQGSSSEFTDRDDPPSLYQLAFLAPERIKFRPTDEVRSVSFAADVFAFSRMWAELLNGGESPYYVHEEKLRFRRGGREPHLDVVHDDILDIMERCGAENPSDRPDIRSLIDQLAMVARKPRHFLSSLLATIPTYIDNPNVQSLVSFSQAREMDKMAQFNRETEVLPTLDMFAEILLGCYSGRYNLPPATRIDLRLLMVALSKATGDFPPSFLATDVTLKNGLSILGGGYGNIYEGNRGQQHVALKLLHGPQGMGAGRALEVLVTPVVGIHSLTQQTYMQKFVTEVIPWRTLPHQHILPFIGVFRYARRVNSYLFMVMPWMDSGDARRYVRRYKGQGGIFKSRVNKLELNSSPKPSLINNQLHQTALALSFMHSEDVIHGDLRGVNILVDPEGNALVTDFGLISMYGKPEGRVTPSNGCTALAWTAPENLVPSDYVEETGVWTISWKSDIYSFGCVCVELYNCTDPLGQLSERETIQALMNSRTPQRPCREGDEMSDALWSLVSRCLQGKNPSCRPKAHEIVDAGIINMV